MVASYGIQTVSLVTDNPSAHIVESSYNYNTEGRLGTNKPPVTRTQTDKL